MDELFSRGGTPSSGEKEANYQRALKEEQERKTRLAAEAEAKRKADEAESRRLAEAEMRIGSGSGGSGSPAAAPSRPTASGGERGERPPMPASLPEFPLWPPPAASAFYVLPDNWFANRDTVGEVVGTIIPALERNGYVERSFFKIKKTVWRSLLDSSALAAMAPLLLRPNVGRGSIIR
jgi:hypothetical protein